MYERFEERKWEMVVSGSEFFRGVPLAGLAVLRDYQYEVGPVIMIAWFSWVAFNC